MPNYTFSAGAKFRPFSYQEMLQPLQAYTNEYNTLQEGIGELGAKADVFEQLANQQTDPQSYTMYKQYSSDLTKQAESLAKEGLTPASRQGLLDMKRRYSSEIIPIEQAYKRRGELVDEQRKAMLSDPTLMFDRTASALSLDELISNPALSPQSSSGALLTKQVGQAAQNLAKDVRENPRKWAPILGNQYYESMMQRGFRPEEVLQAIQNNPNASPILSSIVEDAVKSSGVGGWGDTGSLSRAYDYAKQGLWQAVGDTQYQVQSNKAYDYAMKAKAGAVAEERKEPYRVVPKTSVDITKKTTQLKEDLDFIRAMKADPNRMNEKGVRHVPGYTSVYGTTTEGTTVDYKPNVERLQKITDRYGYKNGNYDDLMDRLQKDINSSAVRSFTYKPDITQSDLIEQVIKENSRTWASSSGTSGLYEFEKGKKGDPVKVSDIKDYFTGDSDLSYDPDAGIIINSTDKSGKTRHAVIDPELIDDAERTVATSISNIDKLLNAGEPDVASIEIRNLMRLIDAKFNTLAKRQSSTTSKTE